jgi:hypothetical protein
MPRQTITNFSRGEFGPQLYGRVDVPQYSAGAKEITNWIIQRYGGAAFRPGFRFVGEARDATKTHRYVPFVYSMEQAYVLALEDSRMNVIANGGLVTYDNLKILSVTPGITTILEIAFHDFVAVSRIYIDGVVVMEELNGRFAAVLSVPDANHVEVNVDSTSFGAFVSSDGITRTGAPVAPPAPEAPPPAPPAPEPPPSTAGPGTTTEEGGTGGYLPPPRLPRGYKTSYQ